MSANQEISDDAGARSAALTILLPTLTSFERCRGINARNRNTCERECVIEFCAIGDCGC